MISELIRTRLKYYWIVGKIVPDNYGVRELHNWLTTVVGNHNFNSTNRYVDNGVVCFVGFKNEDDATAFSLKFR